MLAVALRLAHWLTHRVAPIQQRPDEATIAVAAAPPLARPLSRVALEGEVWLLKRPPLPRLTRVPMAMVPVIVVALDNELEEFLPKRTKVRLLHLLVRVRLQDFLPLLAAQLHPLTRFPLRVLFARPARLKVARIPLTRMISRVALVILAVFLS